MGAVWEAYLLRQCIRKRQYWCTESSMILPNRSSIVQCCPCRGAQEVEPWCGLNLAWPPCHNHKEKQVYWIPGQLISPQQFWWMDLLTPKQVIFMLWYTLCFPPTRRAWRQTMPSHQALILWLWRWTLVLPGLFPSAPGLADVHSGCTFTWQTFPSSINECRVHGTPWGTAPTESLGSICQGSHSSLAEQITQGDSILDLIVPEGAVMNVPIIPRSSPPPVLPHVSWKPQSQRVWFILGHNREVLV